MSNVTPQSLQMVSHYLCRMFGIDMAEDDLVLFIGNDENCEIGCVTSYSTSRQLFGPTHEADIHQAHPGVPEVSKRVPGHRHGSTTILDHDRQQASKRTHVEKEGAAMLAFILTLGLALIWQLAAGSAFALLWNLAAAAAFGLPPVTWLQGVGIYLVIRLIVSPPKLELTLGGDS